MSSSRGAAQRRRAPRVPVHRVVLVLQEVGAGLAGEPVGHRLSGYPAARLRPASGAASRRSALIMTCRRRPLAARSSAARARSRMAPGSSVRQRRAPRRCSAPTLQRRSRPASSRTLRTRRSSPATDVLPAGCVEDDPVLALGPRGRACRTREASCAGRWRCLAGTPRPPGRRARRGSGHALDLGDGDPGAVIPAAPCAGTSELALEAGRQRGSGAPEGDAADAR